MRRYIFFFLNRPTKQRKTHRKLMRVTSRRSTHSTHPTLENVKPLRISFFPSLKAALVRPLSFVHPIDVCQTSFIPSSFHILSVIRPTPIWNVDDISAFSPIILWAGLRAAVSESLHSALIAPRSHLCLYVIFFFLLTLYCSPW